MVAARTRIAIRHARNRGFTLVELLIASMLLSIVMTAVYTLFHSAIGSWRAVEQDFDAYQDARNLITIFQREMNNILPRAGHLFEGEKDEVTMFIVAEPMNVEEAEGRHLLRVRYRYQRSQKKLIREEALVDMALPKQPRFGEELDRERIKLRKKEKFTIATDLVDFQIRYLWTPRPAVRDEDIPPEPVTPYKVNKHRQGWGLPQGIEIKFVIQDPDEKSKRFEWVSTMPMRAPNAMLDNKMLEERLQGLI